MSDYLICVQNKVGKKFGNEPGKATYLRVDDAADVFLPENDIGVSKFVHEIIDQKKEEIVVFIHGYNNDDNQVLARQAAKAGISSSGLPGRCNNFCVPKR